MVIDYSQIRTQLKANRKARGMTQAELAEKTELSVPYISYLETGAREPHLDALLKLARVFEVPLDSIVGNPTPIPSHTPHSEWLEIIADCSATEQKLLIKNARAFKLMLREQNK